LKAETVGTWTNRVTGLALEAEAMPEDNVSELMIEVVPAADLGIEIVEGTEQTLPFGQERRYGLVVSNRGPSAASNVELTGTLGSGLELVRLEPTRGTAGIETEVWEWALGDLAAGEVVEMGMVLRGDSPGTWANMAQVEADEVDLEQSDNVVHWLIEVREEADLALAVAASAEEVLTGQELIYEVKVTNSGPHVAIGAMVELEWLGKVDVVDVELSQGEWRQSPSQVECLLGDVAIGAEVWVRVTVRPARAGALGCDVIVGSATADPMSEDNHDLVTVTVLAPADLVITQSASQDPVYLGDSLSYRIEVQNLSDYTVPDVRVEDWLPLGTEFVSALSIQGLVTSEPGLVEWEVGALEPGNVAELTVTLVPLQGGTLTNTVVVLSAYVDPADPRVRSELLTGVVTEPPLRIEVEGSRVVLSWPVLAEGYYLEAVDRLDHPELWYPDGNPRVVVGDRATVTVKVAGTLRFYRLVRP
jgi:large repetitive protein